MAVPMILDCDPGHDDAVAIVVAARHAELLGITTVAGNAPLERTTHNALAVRELLGVDVPVHSGAARPLVAELHTAPAVHGVSGLDGAELPSPTRPLDGTDAVGFIVETCRAVEGVWLVGVGPLTNVALALRVAPGPGRRASPGSRSWAAARSATARPSPSSTSGPTPRRPPRCSATAARW